MAFPENEVLKIAVVDDDRKFRADVRSVLERLLAENGAWTLAEYRDAETFHHDFQNNRPDIALMDIILPGESGIDAARKIFAQDKRTLIVFVTVSPDFALHGYGVNAVDYLLKPLDEKRLEEVLRTCQERLAANRPARIAVKCDNRLRQIDLADISHIESINRKIHIHTDNETLACTGRLGDILNQSPDAFLQVHKSFAVNFTRIREINYNNAVLDNGAAVPISRTYRQQARDAFFSNLAEEERGKTC